MAGSSLLCERKFGHSLNRTYRPNPQLFTRRRLILCPMASGFIYLIILGMWVAYFVPRWISSHDQTSGKSQERYKSALKIIAEEGNQPLAFEISQAEVESVDQVKKRTQLTRRRIAFSVIAISFFITAIGAIAGIISASIILIPFSAFAIYLVNARRQIIASQQRARRLKALEQISHAEITSTIEKISVSKPIAPTVFGEIAISATSITVEHWVPLADRADTSGVVIIPRNSAPSPSWQPVRVPQPTYVSAPKAVSSKRVIDLTVPGKWSAAKQFEIDAMTPSREDLFDQELANEAAQQHDRAANDQ